MKGVMYLLQSEAAVIPSDSRNMGHLDDYMDLEQNCQLSECDVNLKSRAMDVKRHIKTGQLCIDLVMQRQQYCHF